MHMTMKLYKINTCCKNIL